MADYQALYKKYKSRYLNLKKYGDKIKITIKEPWFSAIKRGEKTIEGRLATKFFSSLKVGDIVYWINANDSIETIITSIEKYDSNNYEDPLKSYLEAEGLSNVLPGTPSISDGINIYHQYYKDADIKKLGILAIRLKLVDK